LLPPGSPEYQAVLRLLGPDAAVLQHGFANVYAVLNPSIVSSFETQHRIVKQRIIDSPGLFRKEDWKQIKDGRLELRQWVLDQFWARAHVFGWNAADDQTPVIPVVHGTDAAVAWKIIQTGFSALSSLDAGWFGRGMYFTSSLQYALPYFAAKPTPSVLVCLAVPGNPYPVVEHKDDPRTKLGSPIPSGYQSHYVLTNKDGTPCKEKQAEGEFYDELVLDQEVQVVPVALIEFDRAAVLPMAQRFQRELQAPTVTTEEV